jgi:Aldo/keto reductase family
VQFLAHPIEHLTDQDELPSFPASTMTKSMLLARRERRRSVSTQLLNRRAFNALSLTFGSSVAISGALEALSAISVRAATTEANAGGAGRIVKFNDGRIVAAIGQGSARLGQGRHPEAAEEEALRTGLMLGMTLVDTAEIYGDGNAERLIGRVIAEIRYSSRLWRRRIR